MAPSKRNDNPQKRPSVRTSGRVSMPVDSARGAGGGAGSSARTSARVGGQTSARTSARAGGQTSARTAARMGGQATGGTGSRGASSQQQAKRLGAQTPAAETHSFNSYDYQSWEVGDVADSAGLDLLSAANAAAVETDAQQRQDQALLASAAASAASYTPSTSFNLSGFTPMEEPQFLDMVGKEIPLDSMEPDLSDFEDLADVAAGVGGASASVPSRQIHQGVAERTSQKVAERTAMSSSARISQGVGGNSQRTAGAASQKTPSGRIPSQKVSSQKMPSQKVGASQPVTGKSPAEKRAESRVPQADAGGLSDGQEAPIPKKKVHRSLKKLLIALGAVVGVAAVCTLLTCWCVWWSGDDTADVQGKWLIGDTTKTMTIGENTIKLNKEVSYVYELDKRHKTITYAFGTLEGGGQYRLSPDKEQLIIVEGQDLTFGSWLMGGFRYRTKHLMASIFHKDSPVWLDVAAPEGTQITLLTRKGSDTAAAMKEARQAEKDAAAAAKEAEAAAKKDAAAKTDAGAAKEDAAATDAAKTDAAATDNTKSNA